MSVDGMIVAASTTLLAESRSGRRGGLLPWTLLVVGSVPGRQRGRRGADGNGPGDRGVAVVRADRLL
jgi:hypothetical protein